MYSPADYQAFVVSNERRDFVGRPTGAFVARYKVKCRTPEVDGSWGAELLPQKGVDHRARARAQPVPVQSAPPSLGREAGLVGVGGAGARGARVPAGAVLPVQSVCDVGTGAATVAGVNGGAGVGEAVLGVNVGAGVGEAVVGAGGAGLDAFALLRAGAAVQAGLERAKRVRVELARTRAVAGAARRAMAGMSADVFDKHAQVPEPYTLNPKL